MIISELILRLLEIMDRFGNVEVRVEDYGDVFGEPQLTDVGDVVYVRDKGFAIIKQEEDT